MSDLVESNGLNFAGQTEGVNELVPGIVGSLLLTKVDPVSCQSYFVSIFAGRSAAICNAPKHQQLRWWIVEFLTAFQR